MFKFAVVSKKESLKRPYPYVIVMESGMVFELDELDREHLETRYHGADSGRPYVKSDYRTQDPWGRMEGGYCSRRKIPKDVEILPSPTEGKTDLTGVERTLTLARAAGATIVDNGIGGYKITYPDPERSG